MSSVIRWHKHKIVTNDSLGGCLACGAWEGELPTDCPGEPMSGEQRDAVLNGKLDFFRKEGWSTTTRRDRLRTKIWCEEGRLI